MKIICQFILYLTATGNPPLIIKCLGSRARTCNLPAKAGQTTNRYLPSVRVFSGFEPCSSDSHSEVLPIKLKTPFSGSYENRTRSSRETVGKVNLYHNEPVPFLKNFIWGSNKIRTCICCLEDSHSIHWIIEPYFVIQSGFEPETLRFVGEYSIQLSY